MSRKTSPRLILERTRLILGLWSFIRIQVESEKSIWSTMSIKVESLF